MESKALKEYKVPDYPQKEQVQAQPSLLRKSVERRWQKLYDLGISGMLVTGLSLSGCDKKPETNTNSSQGINAAPNQDPNSRQNNTVSSAQLAALVAPIFDHGEGRGATGCMVMTPPVFLSEYEALIVIKEELAKYGIDLNKKKVVVNEVTISEGKDEIYDFMTEEQIKELLESLSKAKGIKIEVEKEKSAPLEIDIQDSEKEIHIEYISREEYNKLGGAKSNSSIYSYYIKKVAQQVRNKIQADAKEGIFGVFYDPMPMYNEQGELISGKPNEESVNLLREQVNDFAQWLKEQGIIW